MMFRRFFVCALALVFFAGFLSADTGSTATGGNPSATPVPVPYGPAEFPDWQKDVRRAEILSFGALPFATFMASIYYDVYRYIDHNRDPGYLPWPFKQSSTAVPLTVTEQKNILIASAGISVGVALVDFTYRTIMRSIRERKAEKEERDRTDPVIIEPIPDDHTSADSGVSR